MSNNANDIFTDLESKFANGPQAFMVFWMGVLCLAFGINNFMEDSYSSRYGIQMLEQSFGLKLVTWEFSYWIAAFAPQVATVILFYMFMADRKKYSWAGIAALVVQLFDTFTDIWYRSTGDLTSSLVKFVIVFLYTSALYTAGSEFALSFGFGITKTFMRSGIRETGEFFVNIFHSFIELVQMFRDFRKSANEPQQQNQQRQNQNKQHNNDNSRNRNNKSRNSENPRWNKPQQPVRMMDASDLLDMMKNEMDNNPPFRG